MLLGYANHPQKDVVSEIRWAAENGFDFLDLFLEPGAADPRAIDPAAVRAAFERWGLKAPVGHMSPALQTGSAMPQLRQAAVSTACEYLRVFAEIGVPVVTIHGNWPSRFFAADDGIAWQAESLTAIDGYAAELGLRTMLEPIGSLHESPANLERLFAAVPRMLCHIDLGHANLHGGSPADFIRRFARRLQHIHLHDNNGRADQHLPPGAGTIDWPSVVQALKDIGYDRTITIEVFCPDRDYIVFAKEKVRAWVAE